MKRPHVLLASLVLIATPLTAQQIPENTPEWQRKRIEALLGLPRRAEEIRKAGVPDSTVRGVLDVLKGQKVPATEAVEILETQRDAAAEHGPTDNFGAFVQQQLAAGKRGRDLAAAIRAEHQARGKGKPANAGGGRPEGAGGGRGGRPDGAGAAGGRPDAAGGGRQAGPGGRAEVPSVKKSPTDTTRGKRPGNPNAKRPS